MREDRIVAFATLRLCIDRCEDSCIGGTVYSPLLPAPVAFSDLGEMVARLDERMDEGQFPRAFMRLRSFRKKDEGEGSAPGEILEDELEQRGELSTFVLRVKTRLSAEWQGAIGRPEEEAEAFSGVLELLDYIDREVKADLAKQ